MTIHEGSLEAQPGLLVYSVYVADDRVRVRVCSVGAVPSRWGGWAPREAWVPSRWGCLPLARPECRHGGGVCPSRGLGAVTVGVFAPREAWVPSRWGCLPLARPGWCPAVVLRRVLVFSSNLTPYILAWSSSHDVYIYILEQWFFSWLSLFHRSSKAFNFY